MWAQDFAIPPPLCDLTRSNCSNCTATSLTVTRVGVLCPRRECGDKQELKGGKKELRSLNFELPRNEQ